MTARDGKRFFGTPALRTPLAASVGVALAVGVRNSTDKSFPLGFCAGRRVFVCDNLAVRAELLVRRKHTRHGAACFQEAIAAAVADLGSFRAAEEGRIARLMALDLTDDQALAVLVGAVEARVIAAPVLPKVPAEWRRPTHDYGTGDRPTAWELLNCFTTVLGPRAAADANEYAARTIRLNALMPTPADPFATVPSDAPTDDRNAAPVETDTRPIPTTSSSRAISVVAAVERHVRLAEPRAGHAAVVRRQVDADERPAQPPGGHGRRPRSHEWVEHEFGRRRADRPLEEWHRERRRVRVPHLPGELPHVAVRIRAGG